MEGGTRMHNGFISVSFAYGCWFEKLDMIFKPGLEKVLEPWKGKYKIDYEW